ncbi:hypothetical protein [Chromobacterium sp. LK1]|uniref:hypothetical protein n=1 Tax=Chromobacterium sp. LK1 TaxID=1628193 RepID=UPI0012E2AD73|nr:hypothetical protein [Chromobacterium sp. LK1]
MDRIDKQWICEIREYLDGFGTGGEDLYHVLSSVLLEDKMNYLQFLARASEGHGCHVHEGLGYSLDQDWDFPEDFDEVAFFVGYFESSTLKVSEFLLAISCISKAYVERHVEDKQAVERYIGKIRSRYSIL